MSKIKQWALVMSAVSAALLVQTASAAVVTWTIELNSRTVESLGTSGVTVTQVDPAFRRTITIQTLIDPASNTSGPFTFSNGGFAITTLQQEFSVSSGVAASPLSAEFDSIRRTRTGPVSQANFLLGTDEYAASLGSGPSNSRTSVNLAALYAAYDCGGFACTDPLASIFSSFNESFALSLSNSPLNSSAADVQALSLQDYLDLLGLPGSETTFNSSGVESTSVNTCDASGACTSAVTYYDAVSYAGRVLRVSLESEPGSVPEPGALGLVGLALAGLAATRRQRCRVGVSR